MTSRPRFAARGGEGGTARTEGRHHRRTVSRMASPTWEASSGRVVDVTHSAAQVDLRGPNGDAFSRPSPTGYLHLGQRSRSAARRMAGRAQARWRAVFFCSALEDIDRTPPWPPTSTRAADPRGSRPGWASTGTAPVRKQSQHFDDLPSRSSDQLDAMGGALTRAFCTRTRNTGRDRPRPRGLLC